MNEWIRITSDEKPIEGSCIIARLDFGSRYRWKTIDRLMIVVYINDKFLHYINSDDMTDFVEAWAYPPHKFKGE